MRGKFIIFLIFLLFQPSVVLAQSNRDAPVDFEADNFSYHQEKKVYQAKGDVVLKQDGAKLRANEVSYDEKKGKIKVKGKIKITEKNGDEVLADKAELGKGFKNADMKNVRIKMGGHSRLSAEYGKRINGETHELEKAHFSPCKLCNAFGTEVPLWSLGAYEIEHDLKEKDLFYKHAWLEVFGVPIFYVPYFFHPAPDVKRRSGFLMPSFEQSSEYGFITRIPYYVAPSPSYDVTITPTIVSKEGTIFETHYRQKFQYGEAEIKGSIAQFSESQSGFEQNDWQGHIFSKLRYKMDEDWTGGLELNRVKDRLYLKKYDFSDEDTLTSRAYLERLDQASYFSASAYKFQGLRSTDDEDQIPLVLPEIEYFVEGKPSLIGGTVSFESRLRSIRRRTGSKSHGVTVKGKWERPFHSSMGYIYDVALSAQADGFLVRDDGEDDWRKEARFFPEASLGVRYPFIRYNKKSYDLIEPVVSLVFAPNDKKLNNIPNEDSEGFVFDETNLFSLNRFAGYDLLTLGSRVDYGFNYKHFDPSLGTLEAFLGQSYRLDGKSDLAFPEQSGLREDVSDIVGKIHYTPGSYADFLYRFRFDDETGDAERSELGVIVRDPMYWVMGDYIYLVEQPGLATSKNREQISGQVGVRLNEFWSVSADAVHSLEKNNDGTRSAALQLYYNDECLSLTLKAERRFTRDGDLDPEDSINLRISLTHLGDSVGND